jgi:type II secretory pathway component PulF
MMSARDLALGLRILADLLEARLPLQRALATLEEIAPPSWRAALPAIRQAVREGKGLASALDASSLQVPELVIGIIRAGEAGAGLSASMRRAADLAESRADTQAAVRAALAYPMIVAISGLGAIVVLVTVVLPRFARILADLGQELPASTRVVMRAAFIAQSAFLPAFCAIILLAAAWHSWTSTANGRQVWHRWALRLPIVGNLRQGGASARVAYSLAALLESGVPMPVALAHAGRASGDAEIERRVLDSRSSVAGGTALSQSLSATNAVTPLVVRLARAGEESGRLADMLMHGARMEQQRTDRLMRAGVRMLEPMLLLTFASIVALVAAALLQAVYSVRPA